MNPLRLEMMKKINITTANKPLFPDSSKVIFDNSLAKTERAARILAQIHNPYCFRYGDTGVKLEFADNAPPLQDVMTEFLLRQKSGL